MQCAKPLVIVIVIALAATLLTGCASGYREYFKPTTNLSAERVAALRVSPPPLIPSIERARPGNFDEILDVYAKRGYVMIGHSMFNSGRAESDEGALQQGKDVRADLVLILNPNYTNTVTSVVPITTPTSSTTYSNATATAYGRGGSVTAYGSGTSTTYGSTTNFVPMTVHRSDYGAVYFFKQKFGLGAFFRDLSDRERQELQTNRGAVARLIVDGTPAFNADLLIGDVFLAVDGVVISNTQTLSELLSARNGQMVTFSVLRRGEKMEKTVQLSPR